MKNETKKTILTDLFRKNLNSQDLKNLVFLLNKVVLKRQKFYIIN